MNHRVTRARVTALVLVVALLALPVMAKAHSDCGVVPDAASGASGHEGCGQPSTRLGCDCTDHANPESRPLPNAQSRVDAGSRVWAAVSAILVTQAADASLVAFTRRAEHGSPPLDLPTFLHTLLI